MKKSTWLAVALAATVAVGGIITLQAQDGSGVPARWRQRGWANAQAKLGLTDAQVTQIKAELRAEKATLTELALKLHDAKIALRQTINRAGATEAEVHAAAAQLGAAEGDLAVLKAKLREILVQAQKKLKDLRAEYQPRNTAIFTGAQTSLAAILTPGQRPKFEKIKAENKQLWQPQEAM